MSKLLNILVVDDDTENANALAELFSLDNHNVIVAHDGLQAVEAFNSNQVDLGFFDVMMPGMNGVESFLEIKAKNPDARIYCWTVQPTRAHLVFLANQLTPQSYLKLWIVKQLNTLVTMLVHGFK
jgi:CheY-like chemotaxis protein